MFGFPTAEDRIRSLFLVAREGHELSGAAICQICNLWSGSLYPALMRLERSGILTSRWQDGTEPRLRLYRLAGTKP